MANPRKRKAAILKAIEEAINLPSLPDEDPIEHLKRTKVALDEVMVAAREHEPIEETPDTPAPTIPTPAQAPAKKKPSPKKAPAKKKSAKKRAKKTTRKTKS